MSSHHIVREKQEPALLILGMRDFADEQLGQLLEWSPTILVTAEVSEQMESRGIKIDVVIASGEAEPGQPGVRFIRGSEASTVSVALNYLVVEGYPAVNIVTDEHDTGSFMAFADQINIVVYCANQKIYPVRSGFSKWKPTGETVWILTEARDLTVTGLKKTGNNQYSTTADGFFSLCFNNSYSFIAETIV